MGLYNYIKLKYKCPTCGRKIREWQSKDVEWYGKSVDPSMQGFEITEGLDTITYGSCICGTWIDLIIKKGKIVKEDHHYEENLDMIKKEAERTDDDWYI